MTPITNILLENIPERLKRVCPPPSKLFVRGKMPDLDAFRCVAVIGSRSNTEYGLKACKYLIKGLSGYPIIIISGLAIGIDSIAHEVALDSGLLTIAVPGSGLDESVIYPKTKISLARKIIENGGCLISEYEPETEAAPWMFPERNRIMAGLADAVLVIEAEKKSGTMITTRLALDYCKDVMAVPGSIFSSKSEGPHHLIRQGAFPATTSKDIVEMLGMEWKEDEAGKKEKEQTLFDCSPEEKMILEAIDSPTTRDEIIGSVPLPTRKIQAILSLLEIKGLIIEEGGRIKRV